MPTPTPEGGISVIPPMFTSRAVMVSAVDDERVSSAAVVGSRLSTPTPLVLSATKASLHHP